MNIEIKNGRLIDAASGLEEIKALFLADGKIAAIGNAPDGFRADKVIDATGKTICPGLIDLCARLREPGLEHKATLESEMLAAVAGGVTSLVCPPDTDRCSTSRVWSKCSPGARAQSIRRTFTRSVH